MVIIASDRTLGQAFYSTSAIFDRNSAALSAGGDINLATIRARDDDINYHLRRHHRRYLHGG
jgi:hypothetical protein